MHPGTWGGLLLALCALPIAGAARQPSASAAAVIVWDLRPDPSGGADHVELATQLFDALAPNVRARHVVIADGETEEIDASAVKPYLATFRGRDSANPPARHVALAEAISIARGQESVRDAVIARECGRARPNTECAGQVRAAALAAIENEQAATEQRLAALAALVRADRLRGATMIVVTSGWPHHATPSTSLRSLAADARERQIQMGILRLAPGEGHRAGLPDAADELPSPLSRLQPDVRDGLERAAVEVRKRLAGTGNAAMPAAMRHGGVVAPELQEKAAAYVSRLLDAMGVVIAREQYEQQVRWRPRATGAGGTSGSMLRQSRRLDSEVAMAQPLGGESWLMTRRILAVDGKAVPEPPAWPAPRSASIEDTIKEIQALARRGDEWNLGGVRRDINIPTLALWFLTSPISERFAFTVAKRSANGVSVLRFDERHTPAILHVEGQRSPSKGRFWIDSRTGAVQRTELILDQPPSAGAESRFSSADGARATITVDYAYSPKIGFWVPERMTELYEYPTRANAELVWTVARYSDYRRFAVDARIK